MTQPKPLPWPTVEEWKVCAHAEKCSYVVSSHEARRLSEIDEKYKQLRELTRIPEEYVAIKETEAYRLAGMEETCAGFEKMFKEAHAAATVLTIDLAAAKERLKKFEEAANALIELNNNGDLFTENSFGCLQEQVLGNSITLLRSAMGDK